MDPPRMDPAEDGPRRGRTPPRRAPARCDERARAAEDDDYSRSSKRAEGATIASSSSACIKSYADFSARGHHTSVVLQRDAPLRGLLLYTRRLFRRHAESKNYPNVSPTTSRVVGPAPLMNMMKHTPVARRLQGALVLRHELVLVRSSRLAPPSSPSRRPAAASFSASRANRAAVSVLSPRRHD